MARKIPRSMAPSPEQLNSFANWVFAQTISSLEPEIEGWIQEEAQLNQPQTLDDPMFGPLPLHSPPPFK